jgi:hypothetical protein
MYGCGGWLDAIVSVFPLGVMVTLSPATNETLSVRPLTLLVTWPEAIPKGEVPVPSPVSDESRLTDVSPSKEEIVSVFPLGVSVTFEPATNETLSNSPLKLFTACPDAILEEVIELSAN